MANKSKVQSVEPDIADLVNGWLKSYGLDYKLEQEKREKEINISLVKLNNDIYKEETGLGENDRIYLVAATIIATLGAEGVKPLENLIWDLLPKAVKLTEIKSSEKLHLS